MESVFAQLKDYLPEGVTVTDSASVKGSVQSAAEKIWGRVPNYLVLGHPIAGSEKSGVSAARDDLYRDHRVILTPAHDTDADHLHRVAQAWQAAGAEVLKMSVEEHDEVLAATSHLPM